MLDITASGFRWKTRRDGRVTYCLHLLQHPVLDVNVFEHCFYHHVQFVKALVGQGPIQIGVDGVCLKSAKTMHHC